MVDLNEFQSSPMGQALIELSEKMNEQNMPPVELNVIGGFALMLHQARPMTDLTDIDYVGSPLGDAFDELADEIGQTYKLGHGWINNDGMTTGATMEDFEFATGKLHFEECLSIGNIKINVLDESDVLRMKVIAVDTSLTTAEDGATFDRAKDLPDVVKLMRRAKIPLNQIYDTYKDFVINKDTQRVISLYAKEGIDAVDSFIKHKQSNAKKSVYSQSELRARLMASFSMDCPSDEPDFP